MMESVLVRLQHGVEHQTRATSLFADFAENCPISKKSPILKILQFRKNVQPRNAFFDFEEITDFEKKSIWKRFADFEQSATKIILIGYKRRVVLHVTVARGAGLMR